jgi:hypothetical protein
MENSLSPAFVKINYASEFGQHVMTVPSVPIVADVTKASGFRFDLRGAEIDTDVTASIRDFVNLLKVFWTASTTFTDFTAFTQATPTSVPVPVVTDTLNIVGTSSAGIWHKAVQATWTWRADDFTLSKIVMLDSVVISSSFDRIATVGTTGNLFALSQYITAAASWLASRGGGRPSTFLQVAQTLNEKLRRSYHMN